MARSHLVAIGTALLVSCSGASAQEIKPDQVPLTPLPEAMLPNMTVPPIDRDRIACEASLQAYDKYGCDKNCTDKCKSIGSDLSECKNIGKRSAVACRQ
jgi:hypothetical protein